jgi:hypothetical protein
VSEYYTTLGLGKSRSCQGSAAAIAADVCAVLCLLVVACSSGVSWNVGRNQVRQPICERPWEGGGARRRVRACVCVCVVLRLSVRRNIGTYIHTYTCGPVPREGTATRVIWIPKTLAMTS